MRRDRSLTPQSPDTPRYHPHMTSANWQFMEINSCSVYLIQFRALFDSPSYMCAEFKSVFPPVHRPPEVVSDKEVGGRRRSSRGDCLGVSGRSETHLILVIKFNVENGGRRRSVEVCLRQRPGAERGVRGAHPGRGSVEVSQAEPSNNYNWQISNSELPHKSFQFPLTSCLAQVSVNT